MHISSVDELRRPWASARLAPTEKSDEIEHWIPRVWIPRQRRTTWCWAAAATGVANSYLSTTERQCECVERVKGWMGCCPDRESCDGAANPAEIGLALGSAWAPPAEAAPADVARIAAEIVADRAVVVALRSKGHIEVVIGVLARGSERHFALRDPWYENVVQSEHYLGAATLVKEADAVFYTRRPSPP